MLPSLSFADSMRRYKSRQRSPLLLKKLGSEFRDHNASRFEDRVKKIVGEKLHQWPNSHHKRQTSERGGQSKEMGAHGGILWTLSKPISVVRRD